MWPSTKLARPRREVAMRALYSRVGAPGLELGPCAGGARPELPKEPWSGVRAGCLQVRPGDGPKM